jgi:hypothetical protein
VNARRQRLRLNQTPMKHRHSGPAVGTDQRSRTSAPTDRIEARHALGESLRALVRTEIRPREAKIVPASEVPAFIEKMRAQFWGLAPDAIEAIRYSLQVRKDARIACKILQDLGIATHKV